MTPHNKGVQGSFAKTVLLPGDPLRAKFTAENFLEDAKQITDARNVLGYTGKYKGTEVSVMSSGMGGPSAGIYSYELYTHYNVENIIRIGTSGGLQKDLKPGCLILAMTASTDSAWAHQYSLNGTLSPAADWQLFKTAEQIASEKNLDYRCGMIFSSDLFSTYNALGPEEWKKWARMGALAQDMETYALYCTALWTGKKALSILTMTDNVVTKESFEDSKRMVGNSNMILLALETAVR